MKKKLKDEKGITLVALVVTIVVLLILAGVTITMLFGENGIIKKAQEAKEATERDQQEIEQGLQDLNDQMDTILNGNSGSGTGDADPTKVANNIGSVISETENTDLTDAYNNKITIPAGFHIVSTSEDSTVSYTYSGNGIPAVQDGIVVADSDGNQFVWIPVGTINNKADDSNGPTTPITLARYTFNVGTYDSTTKEYNGDGSITSTVKDGSELKISSTDTYGYLEELATASTKYSNTKAKDIEGFLRQSNAKGGYYLARYEASYGRGSVFDELWGEEDLTNAVPLSQPSTAYSTSSMSYTAGTLWNFIRQQDAAIVARNMYTNDNYKSDLVNSYAWDTAIVFIQTYSGDSDYSKQKSLNSSLGNTGERNDGTTDKVCNIFDMASNTSEWTTETSTYRNSTTARPCGYRGGDYWDYDLVNYAADRNCYDTTVSSDQFSFRVTLYVQ